MDATAQSNLIIQGNPIIPWMPLKRFQKHYAGHGRILLSFPPAAAEARKQMKILATMVAAAGATFRGALAGYIL